MENPNILNSHSQTEIKATDNHRFSQNREIQLMNRDSKSCEQNAEENNDVSENEIASLKEVNETCWSTSSCIMLKLKETPDVLEIAPVSESIETNDNENGEDIDLSQDDNSRSGEKIISGQVVNTLPSSQIYPKLKGYKTICDDPEIANTKRQDFRLSEGVVEDSQRVSNEQTLWEATDGSLTSNYSEFTTEYKSSSTYIQPAVMKGMASGSLTKVQIGSTSRTDVRKIKKKTNAKEKRNGKFLANCTCQSQLLSTVKKLLPSDKTTVDGKLWSRKKHRFKKSRKKCMTAKHLWVKRKHSPILSKDSIGFSTFCQKVTDRSLKKQALQILSEC